jgi:hypothetical protein
VTGRDGDGLAQEWQVPRDVLRRVTAERVVVGIVFVIRRGAGAALPPQLRGLTKVAYGMVQARLQSMIDAVEAGRPPLPPARRAPDELAKRHAAASLASGLRPPGSGGP